MYKTKTVPTTEKREYNVKNLTPFRKGEARARQSPGRPPTKDFAMEFRLFMSQGKRSEQLFKNLAKRKPESAMAHLAGRPVETQVQLVGEMASAELERAVARVLAVGGCQDSGQPIKTPHIES